MLEVPFEMCRFRYGTKSAEGLWRVACDCLALYTLEEMSGRTIDDFFDVKDAFHDDVTEVSSQLLALVLSNEQLAKAEEANRKPDDPPPKGTNHGLNALLTRAADLLQKLMGLSSPRRFSDWCILIWSMTEGYRQDAGIPLTYREFLRVLPTGPDLQKLQATCLRLYLQHVTGVKQAVALGNDSASGQEPKQPQSPAATTGPGGNTLAVWLDDPEEHSGVDPSPPS